jgi:hypothetical protein
MRTQPLDSGIGAEAPIRTAEQDRLRRADFAGRIAAVLSELSLREGRVFAIRGGLRQVLAQEPDYISYYHVPAQFYGLLFGSVIAGIMAMNMVNTRLVTKLGSDRLLRIGTIGAAIFGLSVAVATAQAGVAWRALRQRCFCFQPCRG